MDTERLLLGGVLLSVFVLLSMLMVAVGDQYSRFGSALRCALASAVFALLLVFGAPVWLQENYGIGLLGNGVVWIVAAVGTVVMAAGAIVQFVAWLRWGEGDEPLPSPKRDTQDRAEREQT